MTWRSITSISLRWRLWRTRFAIGDCLVRYFLLPALERIKNTYCMGKRPFLYFYLLNDKPRLQKLSYNHQLLCHIQLINRKNVNINYMWVKAIKNSQKMYNYILTKAVKPERTSQYNMPLVNITLSWSVNSQFLMPMYIFLFKHTFTCWYTDVK